MDTRRHVCTPKSEVIEEARIRKCDRRPMIYLANVFKLTVERSCVKDCNKRQPGLNQESKAEVSYFRCMENDPP